MKKINLYLQHGWGFDGGCWHDLLPYLAEQKVFFADRGYFGLEKTEPIWPSSGFSVTLTHSLGLHLIDAAQLAKTDLLVIISGFQSFHGEESIDGRFSRRHVARMLTDLRRNPLALLNKFYDDCLFPGKRIEGSFLNTGRLQNDLLLLDRHSLDVAKISHIPIILVLHGNKDRIVPMERGVCLAASLPHATFMEIDGAGHGLPFTHPDRCWQILSAAIKEIF